MKESRRIMVAKFWFCICFEGLAESASLALKNKIEACVNLRGLCYFVSDSALGSA